MNYIETIRYIWNKYIVFFILILFTFLTAVISRCNILDPIMFVFVQLAFIFMPGYALQKSLGLSYQNSLVRGLVSYATGYTMSILLYLVMLMMGIQHLIIYIYIIICVISAIYLYYTPNTIIKDGYADLKEIKTFMYILLIALTFGMVLYQFPNLNPSLKQYNTELTPDLVFWMRNTVAATKCYPLPELSVLGKVFFYHYFTSINLAFLKYTTGIEIYDLCFVYSYLVTVFLVVSGLYVACKELINSNRLVFVTMCFALFTQSLEPITHVYYSAHIYLASFGFAEGMGMFFFTLYFYLRMIRDNHSKWKLLLFTMLLFFSTSGLKGPIGAILLVGIAIGSLYLMFCKNDYCFGLLSGGGLLLVFVLTISLFVININGSTAEGSTAELSLSIIDTLFHSPYFKKVYLFLLSIGLLKPVAYILILIPFLISSFLIPFLVYYVTYNSKKTINSSVRLILIGMISVGVFLGLFVSQKGNSQSYFLFIGIPLLFLLSLIKDNESEFDYNTLRNLRFVFIIGVFISSIQYHRIFLNSMVSLVRSYSLATEFVGKVLRPLGDPDETGISINKSEIDGLRWLRANSSTDAIILSNKVLSEQMGSRSFWVSSLSERQTFFESYDYSNVSNEIIETNCNQIRSFYEGDINALNYLKKQGCTHAVIFNGIVPNNYPENCNVIYKKKNITIVEL